MLEILEKGEQGGALARLADDLPLFQRRPRAAPSRRRRTNPPPRPLLRDTRPDELTPREALDLLYRLKALAADDEI